MATSAEIEKVLRKIYKLKSDGKIDKALEALQDEIKKAPRVYELLHEQVDILFSQNREREALAALDRAWSAHPTRREEILGYLQQIKEIYPDLNKVTAYLVTKFLAQRNLKAARELVRYFSEEQLDALRSDFQTRVFRIERTAIPGSVAGDDLLPFYGMFTIHEIKNEWDKVISTLQTIGRLADRERNLLKTELERLLKEFPDNIRLHEARAEFFAREQQWDNFITELAILIPDSARLSSEFRLLITQSIQQNSNRWELIQAQARLLINDSSYDEAIDLLMKLGETFPQGRPIAIQMLQEIKAALPDRHGLNIMLTRLYLAQNQVDEAVAELADILNRHMDQNILVIEACRSLQIDFPQATALNYPLGDALVREKMVEGAIRAYSIIFTRDPLQMDAISEKLQTVLHENRESVPAHNAVSYLLFKQGKFAETAVVLHHLYVVSPATLPDVLNQLRSLAKQEAVAADVNLRIMQIHLDAGNLEEGLDHAAAVLRLKPDEFGAILAELDAYLQTHPQQADWVVPFYHGFLESRPEDSLLRLAIAEAFLVKQAFDEAALVYKEVAYLDDSKLDMVLGRLNDILLKKPNYLPVLKEMLDIYLEFGQIEKAAETLDALELQKLMPLKDVIQYFYTILEKQPTNKFLRVRFAKIYQRNELLEHAAQTCDEAIRALPENDQADFYLIKVHCLLEQSETVEATLILQKVYALRPEFAPDIITQLKRVLDINPTHALSRKLLADIYLKEGHLSTALQEYLLQARLDPACHAELRPLFENLQATNLTDAQVALALGDLYVILDQIDRAIQSYIKAVQLNLALAVQIPPRYEQLLPMYYQNARLHLAYADTLIRLSRFDRAMERLDQAYALDIQLQHFIVAALRHIIKREETNIDARQRLLNIFIHEKAFLDANRLIEEILSLDSTQVNFCIQKCGLILSWDDKLLEPHWTLIKCYRVTLNLAAVLQELQKLVEIDRKEVTNVITYFEQMEKDYTDSPPFLFAFGDMLTFAGDYPRACETYWSVAWQRAGLVENAVRRLENLLQFQPRSAVLHSFIGELYLRLENYEKAKNYFVAGLKLVHSGDLMVELYLDLSYTYSLMGNDKQAEIEFARSLKFDPQQQVTYRKIRQIREAGWHNQLLHQEDNPAGLAELYKRLGRYDEALQALQTPDDRIQIAQILDIHRAQGRYDLLIEKALSLEDAEDDPEILSLLAASYCRQQNLPAYIATLKQIVRHDPTNIRAQKNIAGAYKQLTLNKLSRESTRLVGRTQIHESK